jgi:hypothetical protein
VDPVPDPLLFFCSARESNPGPLLILLYSVHPQICILFSHMEGDFNLGHRIVLNFVYWHKNSELKEKRPLEQARRLR